MMVLGWSVLTGWLRSLGWRNVKNFKVDRPIKGEVRQEPGTQQCFVFYNAATSPAQRRFAH